VYRYREIPPELQRTLASAASGHGVAPTIDPRDFIFWYVLGKPVYRGRPEAAVQRYFESGRQSALNLKELVGAHLGRTDVSILDFASGYGCVARHLPVVLPDARVVACDIHEAAVAFSRAELGIEAVASSRVPEELRVSGGFDVVFALSFLTHMPKDVWARWLRALVRRAAPGGLVIFTTHGSKCALDNPQLPPPDEEGFTFVPGSEQADLDAQDYGHANVSFAYVYEQIRSISGVELVRFHAAYWWGNQDLFVLAKQS
jgi:SAM-dependent methyltransferase